MKCGPNLGKYLKKRGMEVSEKDFVQDVSAEPMTDEDEAPGAAEGVDDDPIKGYKMKKRKAGE